MQSDRQRIDKWLFFTRVVKSRTLAAELASSGRIRVNREKIDKPGYSIKLGDVLTIALDHRVLVYRVLDLGERRGPAPEAQMLYEDLSPPIEPRNKLSLAEPAPVKTGGDWKQARREVDRLKRSNDF
ncbi:RNA-binding S4 domain-containing protein [Limoniibacter endophyticus]|uniref:RNA-binding protein S4 n=1 Tax=Limoniibacter endophyticus TaxID=1565040 RepID=A0A8J3DKR6_9HYPH|nr:RNA-binding S4 domain-containing protein [Limoniibacter endophyticus]GHC77198.1 RNA-binding protein S4 [Limoniibacter endophyticus]